MTKAEAIEVLKNTAWLGTDIHMSKVDNALRVIEQEPCVNSQEKSRFSQEVSQEPCEDAVSREDVINIVSLHCLTIDETVKAIRNLPPVTQKSGKCKDCKYFEYDSVAKVDGIPLIVAHEICNKWGNGCKTSEDGYCYLFEPQESEEQTE